jgi:hypothetical protein
MSYFVGVRLSRRQRHLALGDGFEFDQYAVRIVRHLAIEVGQS